MVINRFISGHTDVYKQPRLWKETLFSTLHLMVLNTHQQTNIYWCLFKIFHIFYYVFMASVITKDTDRLLLVSGVLKLFVVNAPSILIGKPQPQSAKQSRICFIIPPFLRNVGRASHRCAWTRTTVNRRKIQMNFQAWMLYSVFFTIFCLNWLI